MTTRYLNIEAKQRRDGTFIASLEDFSVSDGEVLNSEHILSNPDVSLYCLDDEAKRAIFVELPPNVDLTTVPFIYTTQYEEAKRLIAVPYDTFCKITKTLPSVEHLIMTYISGRSGSTLLSHVFNELDNVMSLSEPDVIPQFVHLRSEDKSRDAELRELMDCTVRVLFKRNLYKEPTTHALKFRMETLRVMDLFQQTFPHAKNLYLYRDCAGFVASFYRIMRAFEAPEYEPLSDVITLLKEISGYDLTSKTSYFEPDTEQLSNIQFLTLFWLIAMESYLAQAAKGIPILAVRYADLKASRERVLTAIFKHCDLPVERAPQPFKAFERDAQAGSALARENPKEGSKLQLTDKQKQEIACILAQHPVIKHSDFIVPNTLKV
jgi:hypothetical protein